MVKHRPLKDVSTVWQPCCCNQFENGLPYFAIVFQCQRHNRNPMVKRWPLKDASIVWRPPLPPKQSKSAKEFITLESSQFQYRCDCKKEDIKKLMLFALPL
jgi:hypothetical protein